MNIGGALATYGAAKTHLGDLDAVDMSRHHAALQMSQLQKQIELSELEREAWQTAMQHHAAKEKAKTMPPVAAPVPTAKAPANIGGAGVVVPGVASSPGSEAEPYANGGLAGSAREGKFDGVFDAAKWDGTVKGLPTIYKYMLHADTGHHPDDEHFIGKVLETARQHGQQEQALANGGMAGAPPFPGFNNGGSTGAAPAEGIKQGSMQHRADLQSQIPTSAPAPQTQGPGGVNFFTPGQAPKPRMSPEEWERLHPRPAPKRPVPRADGGMMGGALDADGGLTHGPGTTTSDSIPARLSKGEFVMSADTVRKLGTNFFQKLQDKYHTEV
jgi:hypothetical protein